MAGAAPKRTLADRLRNLLDLLEEPSEAMADREARAAEPAEAPKDGVATGRFSLVGLDQVRDRLGPRWPALAGQVHQLAHSVISSHLVKGDVFEEYGETSYVVLFAQLTKLEADFKCRVIAKEITKRLLGSEWQSLATVEATFAQVPKTALFLDDLDAALAQSLDRGQRVVTSELDGDARGLIQERECPPVTGWSDLERDEHAPAFRPIWENDPQEGERRVVVRELSVEAARQIRWRYLPVWDSKLKAAIYFRLVASGDEVLQIERAAQQEGAMAAQVLFEADLARLKRMLGDLVRLSATNRRVPVVSALHVRSLEHDFRRREILRMLAEQPLQIRQSAKLSLIATPLVPDTRPINDFVEKVSALKVTMGATLPATRPQPLNSLERRFEVITLRLPATLASEVDAMRLLDRFAEQVLKAGGDAHVTGLSTRSLVVAALAAGVRFLSGPAIHAETASIGQAKRLDLAHLYEIAGSAA